MSARGEVVQQVATAYLHAIADASEVDNATALMKADEVALAAGARCARGGDGGEPG